MDDATNEPDEVVSLVREIAFRQHVGHTDQQGAPRTAHLGAVAARLSDPLDLSIAWLHDVLADTPTSEADLLGWGVPEHVVSGVVDITRVVGESLEDYYRRVRRSPAATAVKLACIAENTLPDRLGQLPEAERDRLSRKYAIGYGILTDAPATD